MAAPLKGGAGAAPGSRLVPGAPSPVPVRAVEGELARLREEATQAPDASAGPGALRACTLNLVVGARGGEGPADLASVVAEIMAEHPCRVLLLVEDPAGGAAPQATVAAVCHRPAAGGGLVCGEQVLLAAGAEGRRAVAGAAVSLLVPDLPVALWWRAGSLEADERFARLAGLADRILLDSASLADGRPDFSAITGLVERYRDAALTDLQWGRLTPWRSLTAQFFDPPEMRPCLTRVAEVTVVFGPQPSGASQGLLYAGWLASRLGWQGAGAGRREADGGIRATLEREGGRVRLQLGPAAAGGTEGLVGVSLLAEGEPPARFRLDRAADGACVVSEVELGGRPPLSRTVCVEEPREGELIRQELRVTGRDRIFEEALRAAAALVPR